MLWAMDAPESLQNLELALENMRLLLPCLEKIQGVGWQDQSCWQKLIHQLLDKLTNLSEEEMVSLSLPEVKHDRVTGVLTHHPWYGLLLFVRDFSDQQTAMAMMARVMKLMWARRDEDSDNMRYRLSLGIRVVFGESEGSWGEKDILELSDMAIVQHLETLLEQNIAVDEEYLELLRRYLLGEIERREGHEKMGGYSRRAINCFGIRGNPRKAERRPTSLLETDHRGLVEAELEDVHAEKVEHLVFPYTGKKARELKSQGLWGRDCATDLLNIQERVEKKIGVEVATDPVRKRFQKKQIAAEIARTAQPLSFLWSVLTPWEVLLMLKDLPSLAEMDSDLALVLLMCFIRGVDVEEALKIRYREAEMKGKQVCFEIDEDGRCAWWLPVNIGIKLGKGTVGCVGHEHAPSTHFKVLFPAVLDRLFKAYLPKRTIDERKKGERLTALARPKETSDALTKWISQINRRYRTRLTLLRISRFMGLRGRARQGLDGVHLAYLRSKYELDSETQIYYTRTLPDAVESAYQDFWSGIFDEIEREWKALNVPMPAWMNKGVSEGRQQFELPMEGLIEERLCETGIGAHKVPRKQVVQQMIAGIDQAMGQASKRLPVFLRTIEYHNQYMLYTLVYLTWASGYRAVSSPLPDPRLLDQETGLLHISDKDAEDGYCSRFVWLTPDCVRQVRYYLDHLEAVTLRMAGYNPEVYAAFRKAWLRWKGRPPNISGKRWIMETDERGFTPFVMLDDKGFTPIRPRLVRQLLPEGYQLPLDSNRHYLRSWLLSHGCSPSLIDIQMGHWHHGHEPWGKTSSLAPNQYARAIEPYLTTLLEDLGFASRQSRECV